MGYHELSHVAETLETVKIDVAYTIQMIKDEKTYPVIMQQLSQIHSKLNKAEQMILEDLTHHDLLKIR
jgi:DNA-binding FrmR family transcriptional regulator